MRNGLQPPTMRGERCRHREDRAADDLIDADRRQVPASELAPKRALVRRVDSSQASGCIMKAVPLHGRTSIVVKPRDVMPEGARTLPARYYTDAALFKAELDRPVRHDVVLRRPLRGGAAARPVLRPRAERPQHRRHAERRRRGPRVPQRLPPSRHADLHRGRPGSSPAASSARITRGPTISTDG